MMTREDVIRILFPRTDGLRGRRFVQDTPILPDVWAQYGDFSKSPQAKKELLLGPNAKDDGSTGTLYKELRKRLSEKRGSEKEGPPALGLAYNESHVLAYLTFEELLTVALPLSVWWKRNVAGHHLDLKRLATLPEERDFVKLLLLAAHQDKEWGWPEDVLDLIRIAGAVALSEKPPDFKEAGEDELQDYFRRCVEALIPIVKGIPGPSMESEGAPALLWDVYTNRRTEGAVVRSRTSVKADAACLLFSIKAAGLRWAVIDSGIDATHPAFAKAAKKDAAASNAGEAAQETLDEGAKREKVLKQSRILRTLDFTRLAKFMANDPADLPEVPHLSEDARNEILSDLDKRLQSGSSIDWKQLEPLLEIKHDKTYTFPQHHHGTHVAGIIAGACRKGNKEDGEFAVLGICPDLELYDFRVIGADGSGDEFSILASLQYVRFLNQGREKLVVHGVNMSLSMLHKVDSFACGATPVCDECTRVVANRVVVVAAAGNKGFTDGIYHHCSITDPGNAEAVITVGATHRTSPHRYGVSYFSSRGPTGDGRLKPDLVAPGEKIESSVLEGMQATLDGTSMAAPHVSGAAALLMARNREFVGDPARIKEILCRTATDLGRERYFQGAGMLDILRALQSV